MNRKNTVFRAAQILGKKASNRIRKNGKEGIVTENSWVPRQPFWLLRDGQIDPTFHCSRITWMFTTPMTQSYGRYLILTKVEENQKIKNHPLNRIGLYSPISTPALSLSLSLALAGDHFPCLMLAWLLAVLDEFTLHCAISPPR